MTDSPQDQQNFHPLEIKFLTLLEANNEVLSNSEAIQNAGLTESQVRTVVEWLKLKELISAEEVSRKEYVSLTELGQGYSTNSIPELQLAKYILKNSSTSLEELKTSTALTPEEFGVAFGNLKTSKALSLEGGKILITEAALETFQAKQGFIDKVATALVLDKNLLSLSELDIIEEGSKKRGKAKGIFIVNNEVTFSFKLTEKGQEAAKYLAAQGQSTLEELGFLSPEILKNQTWKDKKFRSYNITLKPTRVYQGRHNAYRDFLDFIKKRFVGLGFQETAGPVVESEFWNMDALFMPQSHPARDIHDVYFVKTDSKAKDIEEKIIQAVARTHETGGNTQSRGWGYKFDIEKTKRLILRSQGTALSSRTLAGKHNNPGKYFSIARCFRYDEVDASHAPDFFQVDGIVIDENASLKSLLGMLKTMIMEIAKAKEMKFVPAYFPFTEPSVEVHTRHPVLGWIEIGGAGIFRPELTKPLGVDVPVIAWGLGVDRMAMMALGINDIRELFTHDLDNLRQMRIKSL